jgi:hypothetical protein
VVIAGQPIAALPMSAQEPGNVKGAPPARRMIPKPDATLKPEPR